MIMRKSQEFLVSIDAITDAAANETEVARYLGVPAEDLWQRDDEDGVLWRLASDLDKDEPLDRHIANLVERTRDGGRGPVPTALRETYLNVGVLYKTSVILACGVGLPVAPLRTLEERFPGITFSIICYPCSDDEEEEETSAEGEPA